MATDNKLLTMHIEYADYKMQDLLANLNACPQLARLYFSQGLSGKHEHAIVYIQSIEQTMLTPEQFHIIAAYMV